MVEQQQRTELLGGAVETSRFLTTVSMEPGPVVYQRLIDRIRDVARALLPEGATVAVVSKGDDALLELDGRKSWHFPCSADGEYAGYHPASSREAIAHLEELRAAGAEYLLLPSTSFWWLDYYKELAQHLLDRYQLRFQDEGTCIIFGLGKTATAPKLAPASSAGTRFTTLVTEIRDLASNVLPPEATVAVITKGDSDLLELGGPRGLHFPPIENGNHAALWPTDSEQPMRELEEIRERGAQYLLIPATEFWWLDHYSRLRHHLESGRHRLVLRQKHVCLIYELLPESPETKTPRPRASKFAEFPWPWRRA